MCNRASQRIGMDVVHEAAPAVDLHDRDPLAIRSFELGIAVDRDLPQVESELVVRRAHHAPRRLAEVAARRGVEDDFGYG
jgi:hypothetical protein